MLLDADLRIVLANTAASSLFRVASEGLHGQPFTTLLPDFSAGDLVLDLDGKGPRVVETSLPAAAAGSARTTVQIIAVRIETTRARGRAKRGRRPLVSRSYHLLVAEDVTRRAVLERRLVEAEKQAAMGQLAAAVLHELANPLANLLLSLVFVRSSLDVMDIEELKQALDISLSELDRVRRLFGSLSGFPRPPL